MKRYLHSVLGIFALYAILNAYVFSRVAIDWYVDPDGVGAWSMLVRVSWGILCGGILYHFVGAVDRWVLAPITDRVRETKNLWDDWVVDIIHYVIDKGRVLAVLFVIVYLSLPLPLIQDSLTKVALFLVGIFVLIVLSRALKVLFLEVLPSSTRDKHLVDQIYPLLRRLSVTIVWIIGGIFLLDSLGIKVTALVAGAGIGGLAIALAAQKPLANLFGALSLILNKPFKVGDHVRIDDNTRGTITEIGLTYTTLVDLQGQEVHLGNEALGSAKIENFKHRKKMRGEGVIGLTYDMTGKQLQKGVDILREIFEAHEKEGRIMKWRVHFESFGDFSQNIGYHFYDTSGDYLTFKGTEQAINFEIKERFEKAKLEFAFPTQEVIVRKT